jgi:acyl dehydratase
MSGSQMSGASPRFAELPAGHVFEPVDFTIDEAALGAYLGAVDDAQPIYGTAGPRRDGSVLVPPMAVAAFALRSIVGDLALEPGAVHGGQDYAFVRPVWTGERLVVSSRVANKARRHGVTILFVEQAVTSSGETVLTGRSMLTVPGAGETAG